VSKANDEDRGESAGWRIGIKESIDLVETRRTFS
jgi:hypothetical protein